MGGSLKKGCLVLALVLLMSTGCPLLPGQYKFTNADLYSNGYRTGLFADTPAAGGASQTDTTTRDVVEPDVIRQDGNILYVLNQYRGLTLIDLGDPRIVGPGIATPKILAQVPTYGYPRDLYVENGLAYVLVGYANNYTRDGNKITYSVAAKVYVVNISDPANAAVVSEFELNGDLVDSRLVGDVLYAVCAQYQWTVEPAISAGGTVSSGGTAVGAASAPAVVKDQTSASWVTSINIADPTNVHEVAEVSFDGLGSVIQATNSAIFVVAQPDWWSSGQENNSTITYVDISDPSGAITVRPTKMYVPGGVADKFKLDVYNNVLRVVSSDWGWNGGNQRLVHITTFDLASPDFKILGQTVLDDAIGETAFATRFDGPRAYIVTYLMKDPLFVADLSDPTAPKIVGSLVMPGWLTYIEPQGNRLIALGVDDTNGQRVACSMFDVSDPANPKMIGDRVTFGDAWSWSSAYTDVNSFTVLTDVLIVPFSGWDSSFGGYDRLQFISYSDAGLAARGYVDVNGQILRSFDYNGAYYGVTSEQLATINGADLDHPAVINSTVLAEYVSDFLELTPALGAEIVTSYDTGKILVETVSLDKALGQVEVEIGSLVKAHATGTTVVLVGMTTDSSSGQSYYAVAVVNCAKPEAPVATTFKVDVQPYWGGYYWFGNPEVMYAASAVASAGIAMPMMPVGVTWWYPWNAEDTTFLFNNTLVLRCTSAKFDAVFGDSTATDGLALVDLGTQKVTKVGLGYDNIVSMDAVKGKLVIGTRVGGGIEILPMLVGGTSGTNASQPAAINDTSPVCAYFLQLFDVAGLTMGPTVNVPGLFVQYNPDTNLLVVRDDQWGANYAVTSSLRTVAWNGGPSLTPLSQLALPAGTGTIKGCGEKVYYDQYNTGYSLTAVSVAGDGGMTASDTVLVSDEWASLLAGDNSSAYVAIGDAVAVYDFSNGGEFKDLVQSMSYPLGVRIGANNAYASFGYSGYALLPK